MLGAIFRWFKAVGYLLTGRIDAARRELDTNPAVIRAKFDEIIRDKTDRIQTYKRAVASLIAQQEKKMAKVKALTGDVRRLEDLKAGALAKAKQMVSRLQKEGVQKAEIQQNADYQKCLAAYNDFSSTVTEKRERITELEGDIGGYGGRIDEHKVQLQQLLRELEKVKSEAADTVAEMITANQEKEINDALAGIATDGTAEELQQLREMRDEVKAEARVSKELAGTDTKAQEAEFLEYARKTAKSDEFDALIGLGEATDTIPEPDKRPETGEADKLPE